MLHIIEIPCFSMHQCLLPGCIGLSCYGVFFQVGLTQGQMSDIKLQMNYKPSVRKEGNLEYEITNVSCVLLQNLLYLSVLFPVSKTLIAGWDKLECHRVFRFLCELTKLQSNFEAVLTERPGVRR